MVRGCPVRPAISPLAPQHCRTCSADPIGTNRLMATVMHALFDMGRLAWLAAWPAVCWGN